MEEVRLQYNYIYRRERKRGISRPHLASGKRERRRQQRTGRILSYGKSRKICEDK